MNKIRRYFPALCMALALVALVQAGYISADVGAPLGMLLAFVGPTAVTEPPLPKDHAGILAELTKLNTDYKGKPMPAEVGERFNQLAAEAKRMQDEAKRDADVKNFERFSREIPSPALPRGPEAGEAKGDEQVVGYLSAGALFAHSPEYRAFIAAGMPKGGSMPVQLNASLHENGGLVPVTKRFLGELEAKANDGRVERKAVATISAAVIEPNHVARIIDATQRGGLGVRDVMNVVPTTSNAVEYVAVTSVTGDAAPTAESAAKPEITAALDVETAPVRTLAGWMPVTMQQLQDLPMIQGLIDSKLRRSLERVEAQQILWGAGTGENLLGLMNAGITNGATRTVAGDTTLDLIRRAVTDVQVVDGQPNAVIMHPYDWEAVELLKGTNDRYVWAVIQTPLGPRVWGLDVVVTTAAKNPASAQRVAIVGDFQMGATLYDRQQTQVLVGWINDQFVRNQRTILAEERVALAVEYPDYFAYVETQAAA